MIFPSGHFDAASTIVLEKGSKLDMKEIKVPVYLTTNLTTFGSWVVSRLALTIANISLLVTSDSIRDRLSQRWLFAD